jgi:hypothetical protein
MLPSHAAVYREQARRLFARAQRWRSLGYLDVAADLEVEARAFAVAAAFADIQAAS